MTLRDIGGVFNRYFIVGFFLPAFFALSGLKIALSAALVPKVVEPDKSSSFLVIGGAALLTGLLLLALNYPIVRLLEGYPLRPVEHRRLRRLLARIDAALRARQRQALEALRNDVAKPEQRRSAAWRLVNFYPLSKREVMPTRLGNAIRAFELSSRSRWGLDSVAAWGHIDALLSSDERTALDDARSEFAFFMNGAVLAALAGAAMIVDGATNQPHPAWLAWVYFVPLVLAALLYGWSVGAASRWGGLVRTAVDLHREEVYSRLGLRRPRTFTEERTIALAANQLLLWDAQLPDFLHERRE